MIRVLIVDDSATVRALLRFILESDPEIQVVGMAPTGVEGVRQALALKPDLITMDVHMPGLDGFEATRQIMEQRPTPIVIVSSSVEHSEMMVTFNAMQAGALDVIGKPAGVTHPDYPELSRQLITTVKLMSEVKVIRRYRSLMSPRPVMRGASTRLDAARISAMRMAFSTLRFSTSARPSSSSWSMALSTSRS